MTLTMTGHLGDCVLLAYRTAAASVRGLVPPGLELVTRGEWAFWNIVACRVEAMRPAGLPAWCGITYHHVACRLYVRARTTNGDVEGIHFLRSDADNALVSRLGNVASDFRFHSARIEMAAIPTALRVRVASSGNGTGDASLDAAPANTPVFRDSCFDSPEEAAAFLKYRPLGLSCSADGTRLKLAEVFRDETQWRETPLHVTAARWNYLESLGQRELVLESATRVAPLPYRWRLGRTLPLAERG